MVLSMRAKCPAHLNLFIFNLHFTSRCMAFLFRAREAPSSSLDRETGNPDVSGVFLSPSGKMSGE
jgi:hypothetical protein